MRTIQQQSAVLVLSLLLLGHACQTPMAPASVRPLNVLLIAIDDLRPELGCMGSEQARTPNIDRLASEGVLFTQHFVQVPTCGASRYALLTGRSPARSGVRGGNEGLYRGRAAIRDETLAAAQTLPELFRRSGYRTCCLGKISHTPDGRVFAYDGSGDGRPEVPGAWDELPTPVGPWGRGWGAFFAYADGRHREDGGGHQDLMEFVAEADEELPDGLIARAAVERLQAFAGGSEPFFLGVGFFKPHLPFVAPRADWEALEQVEVADAAQPERPDSSYWHVSGEFRRYDAPFPKTHPLARDDRVRTRRAYLACVRYVDRQVGKLLDALEESGLAESTIVVLWGDHGWHLGESEIWGKHTPYERALRSPLIVRAPGSTARGSRCDALVETLDIYPTLIELAGPSFRHTQEALDGFSLKPLLEGSREPLREAALSYWGQATSVRTRTHRLIAMRAAGALESIELYTLDDGPDPLRDLARSEPELVRALLAEIPVAEIPVAEIPVAEILATEIPTAEAPMASSPLAAGAR